MRGLAHTFGELADAPLPVACFPGPGTPLLSSEQFPPKEENKIRKPTCPGGSAEQGQQPRCPGPHGAHGRRQAGEGAEKVRSQQLACFSRFNDSIYRDAWILRVLRVSPPFFNIILFYMFGYHLVDLL